MWTSLLTTGEFAPLSRRIGSPEITAPGAMQSPMCGVSGICHRGNPGPGKQDEKSLDDQEAEYRKWVEEHTHLPFDVKVIAGTGSGEYLDREEAKHANAELETGKYDLVIGEDLGRIFRRMRASLFCEAATALPKSPTG